MRQRRGFLAVGDGPHLDHLAGRGADLNAVLADRHGGHRVRQWAERLDRLAGRQVPELDRLVRAAGYGLGAVGQEGATGDAAGVGVEHGQHVHVGQRTVLSAPPETSVRLSARKASEATGAGVLVQRHQFLAAGRVEDVQQRTGRVGDGDGHALAVGAERHGGGRCGQRDRQSGSRGDRPSLRPACAASASRLSASCPLRRRRFSSSVGADGDAGDRAVVGGDRLHRLAVGRVPHCTVLSSPQENTRSPLGVKRACRTGPACVSLPHQRQRPQLRGLVVAGRDDVLAVGLERRRQRPGRRGRRTPASCRRGRRRGPGCRRRRRRCGSPSGLKPTPRTSAGVAISPAGLPSASVQTLTVLSAPPLTTPAPSLLTSRLVTAAPWSIFTFDCSAVNVPHLHRLVARSG